MVPDEVRRIFNYLEEAIRNGLDELHRFAAVHPADVLSADLARMCCCYGFLSSLCRHYCIAEKKMMQSLGTVDNVCLPNTVDNGQVRQLLDGIRNAFIKLVDSHLEGDDEIYTKEASKLPELCGSIRVALLGRNYLHTDSHFTSEAEEKLLGKILGRTNAEVIRSMLGWVTSALSQDEQKKMMDTWKHVTRNTNFHAWLSECRGETPPGVDESTHGDCFSDWLADFQDYKPSSPSNGSTSEESTSEDSTPVPFGSAVGPSIASDVEWAVYFCPFCNMQRTGFGLGLDCFHCMTCNGCLSSNLEEHVCWERCCEGECTICLEGFDSKKTGKLPCGHLMHLDCFENYSENYSFCPICKKS